MSKPPGGSRSGKGKIGLPLNSELFALGKSSGSRDDKSKKQPVPERKRDSAGPSQLSSVSKKAKLGEFSIHSSKNLIITTPQFQDHLHKDCQEKDRRVPVHL